MSRTDPNGEPADIVALTKFRVNNFDIIRLVAALQVVFIHTAWHLKVLEFDSPLMLFIERFPGVPIFFFVSGFLISRSYETHSELTNYARNRAFRIFPALWVCVTLSILSVAATGYFATHTVSLPKFLGWFAGQMTVLQSFNPGFLKDYGVGALNGSLWTISVELQFYVLTPLLYMVLRRFPREKADRILLLLIAVFVLINVLHQRFWFQEHPTTAEFLRKAIGATFAPWFYMFLAGIWMQRHFEWAHAFVRDRTFVFFAGYLVTLLVMLDPELIVLYLPDDQQLGMPGNMIDPLSFLMLCFFILAAAYNRPTLAGRILKRNDISYGVYIYHMPIVNFLIAYGIVGTFATQFLAIAATIVLAIGSWLFIERPCMKLKRNSLNPLKIFRQKMP